MMAFPSVGGPVPLLEALYIPAAARMTAAERRAHRAYVLAEIDAERKLGSKTAGATGLAKGMVAAVIADLRSQERHAAGTPGEDRSA